VNGESADLRRAFTAPAGGAPRPEDCPPAETLWAAVHGELPVAEIRAVVDHTASCPACAEDWRLAVEVQRQAPGYSPAVSPPARERRWFRLAPLVAPLAVAAVVVLLAVGVPLFRQGDEPVFRGQKPVTSLLHEGQTLPRANCLLRWAGPADATYEVEVRTLAGRQVALARNLTAPFYQVPVDALAGVRSGSRLEWQVTATPATGPPLSPRTFTFTLQ
jgi:hypothetical protein